MVEHYFSQHAAYTFNATHDRFQIFGQESMRAFSRATDRGAEAEMRSYLQPDASSRASVTLVYRFASVKKWLSGEREGTQFFSKVLPRVAAIVQGFAGHFSLSVNEGREWRRHAFDLDGMNGADGGQLHCREGQDRDHGAQERANAR